jgi:ATP-dependent Clp protease ATP-binding subunit ClpC
MQVKHGDILIADLDKENQKIKFTLRQGKEGKEEKSKA